MKKRKRLQVIAVLIASVLIILLLLVFPLAYKPVNVVNLDPCLSESSRKPVTSADFFNHDIAVIQERGVQADLVIVGASRVYRSFIPQVIEDGLGIDTVINGGTSAQPTLSSYFMLLQLMNRFHPKYVVVGLTWESFTADPMEQGVLIAGDHMTRFMKMINSIKQLEKDHWELINDDIRFSENADREQEIKEQRNALVESGYSNIKLSEGEYYKDTGFVSSTISQDQGNIEMRGGQIWKASKVKDSNLEALDAICDLCQQNEVKLYFVMAPTSMMRTYGLSNYDGADAYMEKYAIEHNAVFFDLNLMRGREKRLPDTMMKDYNHVNGEGAMIVSQCLVDCIRADQRGEGAAEYLYDSVEELKSECDRIVAVKADVSISGGQAEVHIKSRQNKTISPLYRVLMKTSTNDYEVVKDWSNESVCIIPVPSNTSFSIKVIAAKNAEDDQPAWMTYSY